MTMREFKDIIEVFKGNQDIYRADIDLLKQNEQIFRQMHSDISRKVAAWELLRARAIAVCCSSPKTAPPPAPVLIMGSSGASLAELFEFLVKANFDPVGIVHLGHAEATGNTALPVMGPEALAAGLPLVLSPGLSTAAIREVLAACRATAHPVPVVFHPVGVLRNVHYDLSGRVLCIGFPGSGNVLVQSIIAKIMPRALYRIASSPIAGPLVTDHQRIWSELVQSELGVAAEDVVFLPQDLKHVSIRLTCSDGRFLDLYNVCNPHWHTAFAVPSHVLPSEEDVQEWRTQGGALIIVLRNPLDTIVSCAAKLIRPPNRVLCDFAWFRRAAKTLSEYLVQIRTIVAGGALAIHYEHLLERPHSQIMRIAQFLGLPISLDETQMLWEEVGLKSLVPTQAFNRTQNHFFQPGSGKWLRYLGPRHWDIIEETGLANEMEAFGYQVNPSLFRAELMPEAPLNESETAYCQTGDFFHFIFDKEPYFETSALVQNYLQKSGIRYVSNNAQFAEEFGKLDDECLSMYQAIAVSPTLG
jgi:hypothetical protein